MNNKINLKSNEVLNKKFSIALSGYAANEVDRYLDEILEDYRYYEEATKAMKETIDERTQVIKDKEDEINVLTIEIQNLKEQISKSSSTTDINLVKEINEIKKKLK